ncbi:MAG: shikimate kinase [Planctomycetota bacterium]
MNLYLIGYRASGKTTVGQQVAQRLACNWKDSDDQIESSAGMTIAKIFDQHGESKFRKLESQVIQELARLQGWVISLGGGAPIQVANRKPIRESGKVVYLSAPADVLWQRMQTDPATGDRRPDLTDVGGIEEVQQILARRAPIYEACADYTIDVARMTPEQCGEAIVQWWQSVDR